MKNKNHEKVSDGGTTISVAAMKWWPQEDELTRDINQLCFAKKYRGKQLINDETKKIPSKLTRRHCTSKVAEMFDLVGKIMPIISSFKLDIHDLVRRKLDWDDKVTN